MPLWKPMNGDTPRDRPILVRGGTVSVYRGYTWFGHDQTVPVVVKWSIGNNRTPYLYEGWEITEGEGFVSDPTEWTEIP